MPDEAERQVRPRIGVYVCHCGGNISDVVDVEAVTDQVREDEDVVVARHLPFMCSDEGQGTIQRDIEEFGLDRVVVAACTPSLHETTFRRTVARAGLNPYLFQNANIREQVSWAHVHDHAAATDKAYRVVQGAVAKAAALHPLENVRVDAVHGRSSSAAAWPGSGPPSIWLDGGCRSCSSSVPRSSEATSCGSGAPTRRGSPARPSSNVCRLPCETSS